MKLLPNIAAHLAITEHDGGRSEDRGTRETVVASVLSAALLR